MHYIASIYYEIIKNRDLKLFLIILLSMIFIYIAFKASIRVYARKKIKSEKIKIDLEKNIKNPAYIMVFLIGLWCFVHLRHYSFVGKYIDPVWFNKIFSVLVLGCILTIFITLSKFIRDSLITKNKKLDKYNDFSLVHTYYKLIEIGAFIFFAIIVLSIFKFPLTGLLAFGGISGAALAFANQHLIANIFSGVAIYFDRPFSIGDWIYTTDNKINGTVEKIGLRFTILKGLDRRPLYVPNSMFNTTPTINASRMSHRRIRQYVGIRYSDINLLEEILLDLNNMLEKHEQVDPSMVNTANLVSGNTNIGPTSEGCFGSSSINIEITAFTFPANKKKFLQIQDNIMLQVSKTILKHGAQFAFPTQSIFLEKS